MPITKKKSELPQAYAPDLIKVNLCIPPLGTKIVLAEPWSFDLFYENRNEKLIETLGLRKWVENKPQILKGTRTVPDGTTYKDQWGYTQRGYKTEEYEYTHTSGAWEWQDGLNPQYGELIKRITLPRGSKLSVSRIYIRCGGAERRAYNSVTFSLIKGRKKKGEPTPPHGRFWAKLYDVNQIVCYPVGADPDVDAVWKKPETTHLRTFKFLDINDPLD